MRQTKGSSQLKAGALIFAALGLSMFLPQTLRAQKVVAAGYGQAYITVLSKHGDTAPPVVTAQQLELRVNGQPASITGWKQAKGPVEIVLLIDSGARTSLGSQMPELASFIRSLPAEDEVGIAYMQNGQAVFTVGLTSDKQAATAGLRLPSGTIGSSASPYFCLSNLAKHWPSIDSTARRVVVMLTNGVDNYELSYNPDDPYVQAAINDALRAHVVVNSIYWSGKGWFNSTGYAADTGQNLLLQVAAATGGQAYWQGTGDPVTFDPYFKDLRQRLSAQYALNFTAPLNGKPQAVTLRLKAKVEEAKIEAPQRGWLAAKPVITPAANSDACCSLHPAATGAHLGW